MIAISRIIRTSLNTERRSSENTLLGAKPEELAEEDEVVVVVVKEEEEENEEDEVVIEPRSLSVAEGNTGLAEETVVECSSRSVEKVLEEHAKPFCLRLRGGGYM